MAKKRTYEGEETPAEETQVYEPAIQPEPVKKRRNIDRE